MPTLTCATQAASRELVSLSTLKEEMGIVGNAEDVKLRRWIREESSRIADFCRLASDATGGRTFGAESLVARFDPSEVDGRAGAPLLLPWRIPVTAISQVVEDDVTLEADEYAVEPMSGMLYRLDDDGYRATWARSIISVTYTAGWDLSAEEQPDQLARACLELVRQRRHAQGRDPAIKAEQVEGLGRTEYWVGPLGQQEGGFPADVAALIAPYRRMTP